MHATHYIPYYFFLTSYQCLTRTTCRTCISHQYLPTSLPCLKF